MLTSDKRRPPLRKLVERHGKHDDDAKEDRLNARIDPQQVHRIGQGEQKDGAERHHLDPANSAFDADARDHRRRDAFKRELGVDDRLARSDLRGQRETRHRSQHRADHIGRG